MKIIETPVFLLSELSAEVQEQAHNYYMMGGIESDYSDITIEETKTKMAIIGLNVEKIYYSGFYAQGDGACFIGTIEAYPKGGLQALIKAYPCDVELHQLAREYVKAMARGFYNVRGSIRHQGFYYHSGCTVFDLYDNDNAYKAINEDSIIYACRALMDYTYKQLEKDYEYECSFECFQELANCNEWHFTAHGVMKNA